MSTTKKRRPHPLDRSVLGAPTWQCSHGGRPCPRPATHRLTIVCAVEGCTSAAHTYLLCGDCTDNWIDDHLAAPHAPEIRVTRL
jgi:hypothetical protein